MSVTWNTPFEASPAGSDSPALGDDKIRELKEAIRERLEHEHKMDLSTGTAALDGWHIQGSAISYIQADAPTTRPDGSTALSALDNGRIWVDTDDYALYVYIHNIGWVVITDIAHATSDGKSHSDVVLNNTHRGSDGSDHSFIDQDLTESSSPSFSGGIVPAAYGEIGTIIIAASTAWSVSTQYLPNTTVAGDSLIRSTHTGFHSPFNTEGSSSSYRGVIFTARNTSLGLTGTWRLLTRIYRDSDSTSYPAGLLQRIS